ncbi:hypothetical protein QM012_003392 [Aureobasidium pullulans]|uniref:Peptidase M49, dipeptidyl-peptidase III n=1 Tax=Aureobasidium pullulans TaxID=5580 RepID=A0ABR0T978_AURPU
MENSKVVAGGSLTQRLEIQEVFEHLSAREKLYAHHMSRAAWDGTRIILRQVSFEAEQIFDLILELYQSCSGDWTLLMENCDVDQKNLDNLLEYAALFLGNIGNYYSEGDQKITSALTKTALFKFGRASAKSRALLENVVPAMISPHPSSLRFPSPNTQSGYYPGPGILSRQEIVEITRVLDSRSIEPENTRIQKSVQDGRVVYDVLQGSTEIGSEEESTQINGAIATICVVRGDYSDILKNVCASLSKASEYAATDSQRAILDDYIRSFTTESLDTYRESQKKWILEKEPVVENIFGFVEQYHDPLGVRAESPGLVAVTDPEETAIFKRFVDEAPKFLRMLPWAAGASENDGRGPFEKTSFEAPEFTSIHALAYCSTIIFEGINLPNYNDIRETVGFKNVIIANRMRANVEGMSAGTLVKKSDMESLGRCRHRVRFVSTAVHELLGHSASKLLTRDRDGGANFDVNNPPINPLTGKPVTSWYRSGQTWTTVFENLATSVEECRASLVAAYLMDVPELMELFGYTDTGGVTAEELLYNTYLLLAVEGVESLQHYSVENKGQAHSRESFGILK